MSSIRDGRRRLARLSVLQAPPIDAARVRRNAVVAYLGGGKVLGEEERVKSFLKAHKARPKDLERELELSYTAIFTEDSFSGPQKRPQNYSCRVKKGLSVEVSQGY